MVSSGVPILDGLDIVAKTAGNKIVENAIYKVAQSISEGKTIAEPLEKSGVFPPMVCQMIAVGEQSGSIDTMLNKIADFYDDEVDDAVADAFFGDHCWRSGHCDVPTDFPAGRCRWRIIELRDIRAIHLLTCGSYSPYLPLRGSRWPSFRLTLIFPLP